MLILPVRFVVLPRLRDEVVVVPEHFFPGPTRWPGPNRPAPRTLLGGSGHRFCRPQKNVDLSSVRNAVLVILHYNTHGQPAPSPDQGRARPEN
jgi:hypothetical protein